MKLYSALPSANIWLSILLGAYIMLPSHAENLVIQEKGQVGLNQAESEQTENEFVFDSELFRGALFNKDALLRLSQGEDVVAGTYKVSLFINNSFVADDSIRFVANNKDKVQPCFSAEQLTRANVLIKTPISAALDSDENQCRPLSAFVDYASYDFDISRLRLDLSIPNTFMKQIPRGYVSPAELSMGTSIGFINYLANYYYSEYDVVGGKNRQDSAYVSFNGGINLGKWQFRQQSSITNNSQGTEWNVIRSYVKRPLTQIQSELALGQLSSTGRFFSGLNFNGISLATDDRMLPESQRGYAPVIQGIAKTTAKVSVVQNGNEIYQTTVAAGPFKISDLYPTNYNGDLEVFVTEADGSSSSFRVPFSAVPESIRKGAFKYSLDIGRTRGIGEDTTFGNITTQYGLNNAITLNNGIRVADGYVATMFGSAYTNFLGAFSVDATYSLAKLPEQGSVDGWMFGASYSKTFQATNTTIALAGYRFSTLGYYDLGNVISLRESAREGSDFQSATLHEQSRATLVLNQAMGRLGTFFVSGSASNYRDNKPDDYQLQLGYNTAFRNGVSMSASIARQKQGYSVGGADYDQDYIRPSFSTNNSTSYGLSFSFPLSKSNYAKSAQLDYNNADQRNSYQASLMGSIDYFKNLDYSLGLSYDDQSRVNVWNAGLSKRFNYVNTSMNASKGDNYWQTSLNAQGALAIHSGGITLGNYLGDTFALVEAKGAKGAHLLNAYDTKIDRNGYALVSSLTPYRFNTVSLDPKGMAANAELELGTTRVAPYAGSAIKIRFKTRQGFAVLIQSKFTDGQNVPLGADVLNEKNQIIGMVGQAGQVYVRTAEKAGKLRVKWGDQQADTCSINYVVPEAQLSQALIKLSNSCIVEE